jgi:hypothetical protein
MSFFSKKIFVLTLILTNILSFHIVFAKDINVDASKLISKPEIFFSPKVGSFTEGSTFDIPILLNTRGRNINGVEVRLSFDKDKISIIKPSSGQSIIGVWVEPPKYDNSRGVASYVGVIPDGITTNSGLIGTVTFKAIKTGKAYISINSTSNLLLNDGFGTQVDFDSIKGSYEIITKAPDGLRIYSDTHPYQSEWYKDGNPVLSWDTEKGITGYSYILDNTPNTIPDNTVDSQLNSQSYKDLKDGLWYFHLKANKGGVWGSTSHFLIRIDSTPPADFKPEANYVLAALSTVERSLVSFFTTDNLSGIDHYEVGIIDKTQPVTVSPVFVQTESPYQVPIKSGSDLKVIVRAIDKAGNLRDSSLDVKPPLLVTKVIKDNIVWILLAIIIIGILSFIFHYMFGHHIVRHMKELSKLIRDEENKSSIPPNPVQNVKNNINTFENKNNTSIEIVNSNQDKPYDITRQY